MIGYPLNGLQTCHHTCALCHMPGSTRGLKLR